MELSHQLIGSSVVFLSKVPMPLLETYLIYCSVIFNHKIELNTHQAEVRHHSMLGLKINQHRPQRNSVIVCKQQFKEFLLCSNDGLEFLKLRYLVNHVQHHI